MIDQIALEMVGWSPGFLRSSQSHTRYKIIMLRVLTDQNTIFIKYLRRYRTARLLLI